MLPMKNIPFYLALFLLPGFMSCTKDDTPLSAAYDVTLNVSYGASAAQKMDVHLPAGRSVSETKVMVMIHGGGWTGGDKNDFASILDTLKKRLPGYAIFNINYRLSANPNNIFPTQELDVKAALEFIRNQSTGYRISDKIVLLGASAGAHLALLQAYKYSAPIKPRAVVSFFGPGDLTEMYNNPAGNNPFLSLALASAIGATPAQNQAIYEQSSPATFINSSNAVPTILFHGSADPLVSASQSAIVQNKLASANISSEYILYPGGGHGDWSAAIYTDAFNKIEQFLSTHVQ
jgi:acetyl esterase/lipase